VAYAKYRLDYQTLINPKTKEVKDMDFKKRIRVMITPAGYEPIKYE
jgi:hypothetical protein